MNRTRLPIESDRSPPKMSPSQDFSRIGESCSHWMPSGLEGGAYVALGDGPSGFERWLVREAYAERIAGRTAVVAYGYDKGRAYASAFADVLSLNGIASEVSEFLD